MKFWLEKLELGLDSYSTIKMSDDYWCDGKVNCKFKKKKKPWWGEKLILVFYKCSSFSFKGTPFLEDIIFNSGLRAALLWDVFEIFHYSLF